MPQDVDQRLDLEKARLEFEGAPVRKTISFENVKQITQALRHAEEQEAVLTAVRTECTRLLEENRALKAGTPRLCGYGEHAQPTTNAEWLRACAHAWDCNEDRTGLPDKLHEIADELEQDWAPEKTARVIGSAVFGGVAV